MILEDFVNKYNGRYIDFDGQFGYQCVDLMRQWLTEGLVFPVDTIPAALTAKQIFLNFPEAGNMYFTKIHNSPTNFPVKGDIVFWGFYPFLTGLAGHVAICSNANVNQFISFDQNWGNPNFCKYVNHSSYRGVLGWLHPKQ